MALYNRRNIGYGIPPEGWPENMYATPYKTPTGLEAEIMPPDEYFALQAHYDRMGGIMPQQRNAGINPYMLEMASGYGANPGNNVVPSGMNYGILQSMGAPQSRMVTDMSPGKRMGTRNNQNFWSRLGKYF